MFMYMWCIGAAVIIAIVVLPKILEPLIGSQRPDYESLEDDEGTVEWPLEKASKPINCVDFFQKEVAWN